MTKLRKYVEAIRRAHKKCPDKLVVYTEDDTGLVFQFDFQGNLVIQEFGLSQPEGNELLGEVAESELICQGQVPFSDLPALYAWLSDAMKE
jgi:hypothetical protein